MSREVIEIKTESDRQKIITWAHNVAAGTTVEFRAARRSGNQNNLLWSLLGQISKQVDWYGTKLSNEDWKDVLTASLRHARVVPGIDPGTFVPLGMRTSQMTKEELATLIELIYCFGAEHHVSFRELEIIT